jgi:hypothetical protein
MATISVTSNLDVLEKYQTLITQSLGGESAYIRAKETIQDLVATGSIDSAQKAEIISSIISSVVTSINSSSMSTAISWANAEKEIELRKLELAKQLDILDQDILLKTVQVEQVNNAVRLAKVESRRMYGVAVFDGSNNVISLDTTGKVSKDIELTSAQITKTGSEDDLLVQKVQESHAAVHKIVADTYVNYGHYSYTGLTSGGLSTVTANHGTFKTLSNTQQDIAIEQAKGYTYNAWANALTGSASMLGTAIAAEYAEFGPTQPGGILLDTILEAARNLKSATSTVDDAVPGVYP